MLKERITSWYKGRGEEMARLLMELISVPALSPDYGGKGELEKARLLAEKLVELGLPEPRWYNAPDPRAEGGIRPNLVVDVPGEGKMVVIATHLDVVPPGDEGLWTVTGPFEPKIVEGRVYGRGSEDNGQSLVASIYAAKAASEIGGNRPIRLMFLSDEERGSRYGLRFLVERHPGLFPEDAMYLVPDSGSPGGDLIEIAEKGVLWVRLKILGKQVHASRPHLGVNAFRVLSRAVAAVDEDLRRTFEREDFLFMPPSSTFEPTVASSSSSAPNVIPGTAEAVFDCRLLPGIGIEEVVGRIRSVSERVAGEYGASVEVEIVSRIDPAPKTNPNSVVVRELKEALREMRGIDARLIGIGGSTFATFIRMTGREAAVWATIDEMAHQPNEYSKIVNLVGDSMVMARLALGGA